MSDGTAGEVLAAGAAALGIDLTGDQRQRLLDYRELLLKWNRVYNLTAVRDPVEMMTHHLLDSLAVVAPLRRHAQGRPLAVLDVGSGGGLPGVVLAICGVGQVDCIDTVGKKAAFIQQVAATLRLPNLRGVHQRVEQFEGTYDLITSRAFASLEDFVTLTRHLMQEGAVWMAMKGRRPDDEMAALAGVDVFHVEQLRVPGLDAERCIVWMRPAAPKG